MKVLDLQCRQGHSFEGWFGSQADYDAQRERGLVTCPVCNDSEITKLLSAPRLNLGHGTNPDPATRQEAEDADAGSAVSGPSARTTETSPTAATLADIGSETLQQMHAGMMKMVRHVMANTEDVGSQFAEEARKIHYGECEARHIRGQATRDETEALIEEGIDVMHLPLPENLKGPLQ